ncbi:hypothetical protein GCM10022600_15060 [Qipengyuania pelagi]
MAGRGRVTDDQRERVRRWLFRIELAAVFALVIAAYISGVFNWFG